MEIKGLVALQIGTISGADRKLYTVSEPGCDLFARLGWKTKEFEGIGPVVDGVDALDRL